MIEEKKIIGVTTILFHEEEYEVEVYEDGTFQLPDGTNARLSPESLEELKQADNLKQPAQKPEIEQTPQEEGTEKSGKKKGRNKRKKAEKELTEQDNDVQGERKKKTAAIAVYLVLIAGILFGAKWMLHSQQNEIQIVRLKEDMLAGDLLTEKSMEPYTMLESEYQRLGRVTYVSDGKNVTQQIMVKWDDRDDIEGKYMTNYTQAGQYLTTRHVTDKKIVRNPWLAEVQEGQEIYTLPFSATGVDVRLLLPGTHMRVRVVAQFDRGIEEGQDAVSPLEQQESSADSDSGVNTIQADTYENTNSSVSPKAAIVFDDLVTVDMLNSQNESIFEIYMALLKMPVEQRIQYLETKIEESTASAFQSRVIPASLVFALTKEQATAMAEFENLNGAAIKYTILPEKDQDGQLLNSFMEISDQLNEVFKKAVADVSAAGTEG